jgi:imidazolonepropionase-like amidohydrolase
MNRQGIVGAAVGLPLLALAIAGRENAQTRPSASGNKAHGTSAAVASRASVSVSPAVKQFVTVDAPILALTHVKIIDGTGKAPAEDQTVIVEGQRIQSVASSANTRIPAGAKILDLRGYTALPGLVGMHEHLFYPTQFARPRAPGALALYSEQGLSFPRLYLACGITSMRTTGSIEPYTDLNLARLIKEGELAGPKMHVTGPYLEGKGSYTPQMHELRDADDARRTIEYWSDEGVTSFKAYMHITRAELAAAIEAAHERGIKVTGHLCSIGFREAAALGIDDLEHGLTEDSEFVPAKKADECPEQSAMSKSLIKLDLHSAAAEEMVRDLVRHHVAITSTLAIFETFLPNQAPPDERVLDVLSPEARLDYLTSRARVMGREGSSWPEEFKKEMQFEREFVKAGGLLLAGEDPTGYGGVLAGFGDQRELELLVQAGFTPLEAIHIATANGAEYLGESDHIGTLERGKQADLVVIHGDPAAKIADIKKVELVFKDGVGYDPAKLIDSVRGVAGLE